VFVESQEEEKRRVKVQGGADINGHCSIKKRGIEKRIASSRQELQGTDNA